MASNVWSDRPLGVKLAVLVGAGAVSLSAFAVVTVQALQGTGDRAADLLAANHSTAEALEADMMHDAVRGDVLAALLSSTADDYNMAVTDLADHSANLRDILAAISAEAATPEIAAAAEGVAPDVEAYLQSADQIVRLAGPERADAVAAYPEFGEAFSALEESLPTVGEAIAAEATAVEQQTTDQRSTAITLALVVAGVGVAVLALLGWFITSSVVRPLRRVQTVLAGLAEGDLRGSTGVDSKDEVGQMAASLETSMEHMRAVMTAIGDSSTTLASATEELSASAQDMARLADESPVQSGIVATAAG